MFYEWHIMWRARGCVFTLCYMCCCIVLCYIWCWFDVVIQTYCIILIEYGVRVCHVVYTDLIVCVCCVGVVLYSLCYNC